VPPVPLIVAGSLAAASLIGTVHLAVDEAPFAADAAALIGIGMMILAVTAIAGVLLARSRWSRPVATGVAAGWVAIAASRSVSGWSIAVIALSSLALGGSLGPWLGKWIRHLASAEGPPPAAVVALLLLLATPTVVGLVSVDRVTPIGWGFAGWATVLALSLARAVPGALTGARVVHPALSVAVGLTAGPVAAAALGTLGLLAAGFAWRREVAVALTPRSTGRAGALRIPPELAPPGVLDAARADPSGQVNRS
jgi:hypothetical protein